MEKKGVKPTNAQLMRRLEKAVVHIDRTKDTKSCYFGDKGLRLTITDDVAIIETMFHQHLYRKLTAQGYSRPYLYTERIIDIALTNDCKVQDGSLSYALLLEVLKKKEDQLEYNLATYYSWFLYNIFNELYSISEDEIGSFMVYEAYLHNIAKNAVIMAEKKEDMTNKQFITEVVNYMQSFVKDMDERVLFKKLTDDERAEQAMSAMGEIQSEEFIKEQADGSKD